MRSPTLYLLILALLVVQRLHEMIISRRNIAALGDGALACDAPGSWPAMVVAHAALLALPAAEVLWLDRVAPAWIWWPALAVLVIAQGLRLWSQRALGSCWNARGITHPDQAMMSSGPYRFVKHPNYLAVVLEVLAIPIAGGAWRSLALLIVPHSIILARRVRAEEALLRTSAAWRASMGHKPALLPFARKRGSSESDASANT